MGERCGGAGLRAQGLDPVPHRGAFVVGQVLPGDRLPQHGQCAVREGQAAHRLATGETLPQQPFAERVALSRRHLDDLLDYYGDRRALRIGRKYVAWTIKGCAGASRLRAAVQDLDSRERLDALFEAAVAAGESAQGWYQPVFTSGEG